MPMFFFTGSFEMQSRPRLSRRTVPTE